MKTIKSNEKTLSLQLEIETITPVHVGTGDKLQYDLDYIYKNNLPYVVRKKEMYDMIANDNHIKEILEQKSFKLSEIEKIIDLPGYSMDINNNSDHNAQDIIEHIKDAYLNPYFPGSSLKGAIRTFLAADLLTSNETIINKKWTNQNIMGELFGQTANSDIMRSIHVGDVWLNNCNTKLVQCDVFHLGKKKLLKPLFVETVPEEVNGNFTLKLDQFLMKNSKVWCNSNIASLSDYTLLFKKINDQATRFIKSEMNIFNDQNLLNEKSWYQELLKRIEEEAKGDHPGAYIQMA